MSEKGLCGADCMVCGYRGKCSGCEATGCSPFGGKCVAAEYIAEKGLEEYCRFRERLVSEVNTLLDAEGIPHITELSELVGRNINMMYGLPNGFFVKFLNSRDIYLGSHVAMPDEGKCYGVVAGRDFILVCSYAENGKNAELVLYRKRRKD